ncbi:methyltransferase domain-containing protein [Streptomyces sp. DW26H14]|uniref:methyltransferase domain-containing protein n=1 Tax=Streptomyces sp. DW26H14 TaxID=3435395 RepID=UPI00403E2464
MTSQSETSQAANWEDWTERWDKQQTAYLPVREQRFDVMSTVTTMLRGEDCTILDLACGPGSLSKRFLSLHPRSRSIGIDFDPVLLELAARTIGDMEGRLTLLRADVTDPDWIDLLAGRPVDAVLTTTALHWLTADQLVRLYRQLADMLSPGAVLLNGDHMAFDVHQPTLQRVASTIKEERWSGAFSAEGGEDYDQWWTALENYSDSLPSAERLPFEERRQGAGRHQPVKRRPGLDLHASSLRDAGFAEVGVIWANLDNRLLMAVR